MWFIISGMRTPEFKTPRRLCSSDVAMQKIIKVSISNKSTAKNLERIHIKLRFINYKLGMDKFNWIRIFMNKIKKIILCVSFYC